MPRSRNSDYGTLRGSLAPERDSASIIEDVIVMIIVMALAAVMRLWKLGEWSFWADEIFTVQDAQRFPSLINVNPVVYIIVNYVTRSIGLSEWSARLGPCIIGIISVPALYWPARRMFNSKVAAIACLFLVFHPWHIFWSQNVRAYSLAFLFAGLSASLFYLALERDNSWLTFLSLLTMLISIASYTQTVLLIPALVVYVILIMLLPAGIPRGLNGKNLIIFFGPFILGLIFLLIPSVRNYIYSGWGLNQLGRSPLYIVFTLLYGLSIPMAVAAFVGGIHSFTYMHRGGLFMICYAVVPFIALLIISPFFNVAGYYLFFTMPAFLMLAAFCASELTESTARSSRILSIAVILIVLVSFFAQDYLYFNKENGGRPKWRAAFETLNSRMNAGDTLVISMPRIAQYYLKKPLITSSVGNPVMQLEDVKSRIGNLESLWKWEGRDIWFMLDELSLKSLDKDRSFREWVYANCRMIKEFPVYARVSDRSITLWHAAYEKPKAEIESEESFEFEEFTF
ncbi:hypothetical protein GF312_13565 [Candidatus Poribacteria bacterium]|nr:hypothetical protein [Candidatus Poribacteria bacterium]